MEEEKQALMMTEIEVGVEAGSLVQSSSSEDNQDAPYFIKFLLDQSHEYLSFGYINSQI